VKPPDREAALAQYRRRAPLYDLELVAFEPVRRNAVDALALQAGETVLDVGCGTGLSLPLLAQAVGPRGHVVGIEQSPQMIERARARAQAGGWGQVQLVEAPAESAQWRGRADAALFVFTHDVLVNDAAVANVLHHLRPGGRVAAAGLQWAPAWALPVNLFVFGAALHSVTTLSALDRPWQRLAPHLEDFTVQTRLGGAVYLACGRVSAPPPTTRSNGTGAPRRPTRRGAA
jgi:ubiquinone/menaquinone biosynthesis C-methylase UbiE